MLDIQNIEVRYSTVILVLKGVSLKVPEDKIVALLGANGAGKSTTLKAVSGLLATELGKVTDGAIYFEDERIDNRDPQDIVRKGIVQVIEGRAIFEHLTAEENLMTGAYLRRFGEQVKEDLAKVYRYFPILERLRNKTSGYLSGGEQQMLVIGRGLMSEPKLMLVDEASLGLAPLLVDEIFDIIEHINAEEKRGILLVEQNAIAALDIAHYGYVMEDGRIVLDGPSQSLKENEDIKEFYLGLSEVGSKKSYREIKHYKRRKRWLG
ncbi:MAG: ABC transporter ATP-binding protein [Desulfobacteraceae bacterium]|jgi:branched-chain amino acid transport system ATP-binding protein